MAEHDHIVINAVQSDTAVQTITVKPTGLQPATTYQVQSVDTGILGTATGAALMISGIDILQSPNTAAHLLIITALDGVRHPKAPGRRLLGVVAPVGAVKRIGLGCH